MMWTINSLGHLTWLNEICKYCGLLFSSTEAVSLKNVFKYKHQFLIKSAFFKWSSTNWFFFKC